MRRSIFILSIFALLTLLATDAGALGRRNTLSAPEKETQSALQTTAPAQDTVKLDMGIAKERVEQYLQQIQFSHTDTILAKVNNLINAGDDTHTKSFLAYMIISYDGIHISWPRSCWSL